MDDERKTFHTAHVYKGQPEDTDHGLWPCDSLGFFLPVLPTVPYPGSRSPHFHVFVATGLCGKKTHPSLQKQSSNSRASFLGPTITTTSSCSKCPAANARKTSLCKHSPCFHFLSGSIFFPTENSKYLCGQSVHATISHPSMGGFQWMSQDSRIGLLPLHSSFCKKSSHRGQGFFMDCP